MLLIGLLTVAVLVCALALVAGHHDVRRETSPHRALIPADSQTARALVVLRAWDRRRADAWAAGDRRALARLYVPGSRAGRRDDAMLAAYVARGLRVRSMHRQVLSARVLLRRAARLRLEVTDRLVDAVAVGHGVRTALPDDRPSRRVVVLRRRSGEWRVVAVYDA